MTAYKILIVEDDTTIARLLSEQLRRWGFASEYVTDFDSVTEAFLRYQPHLVLLDISLPYYDGYYWCREIRKHSKVPILFLSSHTENMDIVMAVNMGGDDYVTKPFSTAVLIAKINALLRRAYHYFGDMQAIEARGVFLSLGDATLSAGDTTVDLTKNELRILRLLMERKNTVVSREEIMKSLWESESFVDDNTLTVNINRLRKKLADAGIVDFITTKKGTGYMVHD